MRYHELRNTQEQGRERVREQNQSISSNRTRIEKYQIIGHLLTGRRASVRNSLLLDIISPESITNERAHVDALDQVLGVGKDSEHGMAQWLDLAHVHGLVHLRNLLL